MAFMKTGAPVTTPVGIVSFKPEIPEGVVDKARFLQGLLDALSLSKKPPMGETDYWTGWDAGTAKLNAERGVDQEGADDGLMLRLGYNAD